MSGNDEIFVHLFRNKEEFERRRGELETIKAKRKEEQKYRQELAASMGMTRFSELPILTGSSADIAELYPSLKGIDSKEVYDFIDEGAPGWVLWPKLTWSNVKYNGFIPTIIMDEGMLAQNCGFFEKIWIVSNRPDTNSLMIGIKDEVGYLIAYWGNRNKFEELKRKIEDLRSPKPLPPARPKPSMGEGSTVRKADTGLGFYQSWTAAILLCIVVVVFMITAAFIADSKSSATTKSPAKEAIDTKPAEPKVERPEY